MAILMAGGKGTRLKSSIEKPLLEFQGKPLIDHVLTNLINSKYIKKITVATSHHTPKTKKHIAKIKESFDKCHDFDIVGLNSTCKTSDLNNLDMDLIETSGNGYVEDLSCLLSLFEKNSKKDIILCITSDLPFVSSDIIDFTLESYFKSKKSAMSVVVPIDIFKSHGIIPSFVVDDCVPSGLNILISHNINQIEEKLIVPDVRLALNINTFKDLKLATELFK